MTAPISRRALLKTLSLGGAALCLRDIFPAFSHAATTPYTQDDHPFVIYCTFDGGWDQLLACDPRDATDPQFGEGQPIHPGYDIIGQNNATLSSILENETKGTGIYQPKGSQITVGATMVELAKNHWQDLCIVRGLDMGTLTHEVGRRYFLTGKFPRGLAANGSSMTSAAVADMGYFSDVAVPNLVVGMESYTEDLPNYATGLSISKPQDILAVVSSLTERLSGATKTAVDNYLNAWDCNREKFDGGGIVTNFLESQEGAEVLASGAIAEHFDFLNPTGATQQALEFFGLTGPPNVVLNEMNGPLGQAFLAAQAVKHNVSQAVSIRLASGIDHHDDSWETDHGPALLDGFNALSKLMSFLKENTDASGKTLWERTMIVVSSEFARTPTINSRGGRDHHLSSSCLVAGMGIKGNTVIGGTDSLYSRELIDPVTGQVGGDFLIRPPDVHATVLKAMGLSYEHLSNQSPTIIDAMLVEP